MEPSNVTFIIPVYNLDDYRKRNLNFILPYIQSTGCKVIVVEQINSDHSELSVILNKYIGVQHILFKTEETRFHKTGIINYAVTQHVNTAYAWVNDVDYYMKFKNVFEQEWTNSFIQPYKIAKKLNEEDTLKILNFETVDVDYSDPSTKYISLYGALSFIFEVEKFLELGAMDESIYGWGKEDIDLYERVNEKYIIQKMEFKGIHLYHKIKHEREEENVKSGGNDMAVVTCHFNWCGFKTPVKNLNNFINRMELENIPLYGVELSLTDEFSTKNRKNWKHIKVSEKNICFQKEACINLIEKEIPEQYTKIAWIDADLYFTNKNWYKDTSDALNIYKLVQMYERGHDTDSNGNIWRTVNGMVSVGGPKKENINVGFPGGAIAARRDFFRHSKLYPFSFMGAGDTILMCAIYDVKYHDEKEEPTKKHVEWRDSLKKYINLSEISYVKGDFIHEWHGEKQNRNYHNRKQILWKVDFEKDISLESSGLIAIRSEDGKIYKEILEYFENRCEDGNLQKTNSIIANKKPDMAVVTVHFNWANFVTPVKNLNRFILEMESNNIPLYGIELSLTGKFDTEKYPNWIKIKVDKKNICFQKEACINLIEKYIPWKYTKIAWIDHDVYFKNRNWYDLASQKLDSTKIIQLFSEKISTNEYGVETSSIPSLMAAGGPLVELKSGKYLGTPGVALAAKRELWSNGGLYPYSFLGGGDSVFLYSIYNSVKANSIITASAGIKTPFYPYTAWKQTFEKYVDKSCSYIDGSVVHSWHGETINRRYDDRYTIIDEVDWNKSIRLNKYGLVEIVNVNDYIYDKIFNYFKSRNEDGKNI